MTTHATPAIPSAETLCHLIHEALCEGLVVMPDRIADLLDAWADAHGNPLLLTETQRNV